MPINFLSNACKSQSDKFQFGLCDNPDPAKDPAYIDETDNSKWIATVNNSLNKTAEFTAIDHCIDIRKSDGNPESRCDGLLKYDNTLVFTELKSREAGKWLKKGREQLTVTIGIFKDVHDITAYDNVYGNVCNNLRPQSNSAHTFNIQKFFDDTGFILRTDAVIEI